VAERNLLGRAYELSSALEMAKRRKSLSADFVNPYLFGRYLALGFGAFWMKLNRDSDSSYNEQSLGGRTWISYFLTENLIQRWSYQLSRDIIGTPGRGVFPLIAEDKGRFMTSAIGHEISLDYRDNRLKPTGGYSVTLSNEYAGLGGKIKYLKNTLSADYYRKLTEHVILELHAQAGIMNEIGSNKIRVSDKFMMGGTSLRGFDYSGVGPHGYGASPANRNSYDESSLGGDTSILFSAQVNFPLGLPEDLAVSGHVFADVGSLWDRNLDQRIRRYNQSHPGAQIGVYNSRKLRSSVGAGISWASPMGVITIDYGHALTHAKGDERRAIIFSMGSSRF
jgi:outer membrane protein insertion porin family